MANIKLGAIITDIAGSVGGSTFRRTPAGIILYNKQGTQIKSAFAPYSKKNAIGQIFRNWNYELPSTKNVWADNAKLYPVKDKFGADKYLTGRQLYTKLNTQLLPVGAQSDAFNFDTVLYAPDVTVGSINFQDQECFLYWNGTQTNVYLLVSCYRVRSGGSPKPAAHFRRTLWDNNPGNAPYNMFSQLQEQFPDLQVGQTYGFNIQWMNVSGIQSSVQAYTNIVI